MKWVPKNVLVALLVAGAAPATAAEHDCVATADSSLGERLTDQFFYEEGMADQPEAYFDALQSAIAACIAQYSVPDEHTLVFTELNLGHAMTIELRKRLSEMGTDVAMLDRGMIPHIPDASTTFDQMFDNLGPEFEDESARLAQSGAIGSEMADALLGAYSGAFHSTYVSQLKWNARQ